MGTFYWRLLYTCVCAGLVVIDSLRTALGSLKEDEQFEFQLTTLETSVSHAKGIIKLRKIAWSFLDGWNVEKRWDNEDLQRLLESLILICDVEQAILVMDSSEALAPKKKAWIVNSR